jgi:hypothetical protein
LTAASCALAFDILASSSIWMREVKEGDFREKVEAGCHCGRG